MAVTPMMKQYEEAKGACPDAILLFRMGDFYEMFQEDARTAARVLNLRSPAAKKARTPCRWLASRITNWTATWAS